MAEGDGAQGSTDDGTQGSTGETTTGENGTTGAVTETGTQSGTNAEAEQARREAESLRERMKAADQRASKFENELRQLRDKDLPAAEKMQRDFEESQKTVEKLTNTNRELALKVAFLGDNTYTWHNPERALKLVDLSQVTIDDDGLVSGLKDALSALAKSDAYLIKTDGSGKVEETPPGTAPGNNGTSGSAAPKKGAMASRLPVMGTRVRR